jgi:gliding motility-associated-like protein
MKKFLILLSAFLFLTASLKCQISADFRSNISGESNLTYHFESVLQDTISFTYQWDFGDGIFASGPIVKHTYAQQGEFLVSLTVSDGSISETISREMKVQALSDISNVFTPNGDGENDLFVIHTDGLSRYTLIVYSRTGTIVHRSTSVTPVWDGRTPAGEYVHPGIYYYVVRIGNESGDYKKSGFVHLIREPIKK